MVSGSALTATAYLEMFGCYGYILHVLVVNNGDWCILVFDTSGPIIFLSRARARSIVALIVQ